MTLAVDKKLSNVRGAGYRRERRDKYGHEKIRMAGDVWQKGNHARPAGGFGFGFLYDDYGPDNEFESVDLLDVNPSYVGE